MSRPFRVVDLFCGAGGTSTGAVQAIEARGGRMELLAVNHWETAIETHSRNHPKAQHLCKALDQVRPREAVRGEVDLLVASPECTHHSIARGGKPINDQSRMSAWEVIRWVSELMPRHVLIENVKEFETWGPLGVNGRPLKSRAGEVFRAWLAALQSLGYRTDVRILNSANHGAATTRTRLFVRAVRGRAPLCWPAPSHAKHGEARLFDSLPPWRQAREIIDWSLPSQSIFTRKKPLAAATIERIAAGLRKFGGKAAEPFLVVLRNNGGARGLDIPLPTLTAGGKHVGLCQPFVIGQQSCAAPRSVNDPLPTVATAGAISLVEPFVLPLNRKGDAPISAAQPMNTITATSADYGLVEPFVVPFFGERAGQDPRTHRIDAPLPTVTSHGAGALVQPFIMPVNHGSRDHRAYSMDGPMPTITTVDAWSVVEPMIVEYYGTGDASPISEPLRTVTTRDRFGFVQFDNHLIDIHFRMLQPHELAAAMGFPSWYKFAGNREEQVKQIGNAVEVNQAEALVAAALFGEAA